MDKKNILEKIGKILAGFGEIELAYVYGSFLERDCFHDIDVALLLSRDMSPYERTKFAMRIGGELERRIEPRIPFDVRILNHAPPYFQYEVIKKGTLVVVKDRERKIDYEAHLISEYLDLKYMYDYLDRAFLARA